ncbi:MAG: Undecaprenyl-phosphate galactose phosphotransferase, partial [Acidimicrobiales bacterium]|nr:Undecaprenyl-phosphate galactose phosphotransferase [Acidimicrobiales bacterium]
MKSVGGGVLGEASPRLQHEPKEPRHSGAWRSRYLAACLVADGTSIAIAWYLGLLICFPSIDVDVAGTHGLNYVMLSPVAVAAWIVAVGLSRGYDRRIIGISTDEYRKVFSGVCGYAAMVAMIAFATSSRISRSFVAVVLVLAVVLTLLNRHILRVWLHRQRLKGHFTKRVVVVGTERTTTDLVRHLQSSPAAEMEVVGACV